MTTTRMTMNSDEWRYDKENTDVRKDETIWIPLMKMYYDLKKMASGTSAMAQRENGLRGSTGSFL